MAMQHVGDIVPTEPKTLSAHDRLEALLAAALNEDRAQLCGEHQAGLRTLFLMNASLFKRLAE